MTLNFQFVVIAFSLTIFFQTTAGPCTGLQLVGHRWNEYFESEHASHPIHAEIEKIFGKNCKDHVCHIGSIRIRKTVTFVMSVSPTGLCH